MTLLLDRVFPRTLDSLVTRLSAAPPEGPVEAWLFEDEAARRRAEQALAAAGVTARLRTAYKPLLHFFLEEVERAGLTAAHIRYPRHAAAHPDRFLLEAYPLAGLLDGVAVSFAPGEVLAGDAALAYGVALTWADGRESRHEVFAPNLLRQRGDDALLACCGWLRAAGDEAPLATEFEALFDAALACVAARDWGREQPLFDRLLLRIGLPADDLSLGFGLESVSYREALHEDLLFTLRETLGASASVGADRNSVRPGQILPDVRAAAGTDATLRIAVERFDESGETPGQFLPLDTADRPLSLGQVRAELAALDGQSFFATSREGRSVAGLYRPGSGPAVLITGAQHANETSGVVGALRAARRLAEDPAAHFALIPVENVDGYELHQRLIAANPHHMHHAARYTAAGDDISFAAPPPLYERDARATALRLSGAELHLNLHGYPAHEWTRPLSGYLPGGFEMWTLPTGFFLVFSYYPSHAALAETFLEELTAHLAGDAALMAFNARQLAVASLHRPGTPFRFVNGVPCLVWESSDYPAPITLITEAPDETVYGEAFTTAHDLHLTTVLAAVGIYRRLRATA